MNIGCTVENQEAADYRLPLFLSYPMKRRFIACAPLLEAIDLTPYLDGVDHVTVGGEPEERHAYVIMSGCLTFTGSAGKPVKPSGLKIQALFSDMTVS